MVNRRGYPGAGHQVASRLRTAVIAFAASMSRVSLSLTSARVTFGAIPGTIGS
jgi:hypothetical protein